MEFPATDEASILKHNVPKNEGGTMKRRLACVLLLGLLFGSIPSALLATEVKKDNASVKQAITVFFKNKDLDSNLKYDLSVAENLQTYLTAKSDTHQLINMHDDISKKNYAITVTILEATSTKAGYLYKASVERTFNYTSAPDMESGIGDVVDVLVDSNTNKIIDMYCYFDYFDEQVRGADIDISEKPLGDVSKLASKIQSVSASVDSASWSALESNAEIEEGQEPPTRGALTYGNIVSYANNNCKSSSPPSGGQSVPYYDFSKMAGAYDCTILFLIRF